MTTQRHDVEPTGPIESTEPVTDAHYSPPGEQYSQQPDRGGDPAAMQAQSAGSDPYWAGERAGGQQGSGFETGGQQGSGFETGGQPPVNYGAGQGQSQGTGAGSYAEPAFSDRDRSDDAHGQYSGPPVEQDPSSVARAGTASDYAVPDHGATSTGDSATSFGDASATDSTTTGGPMADSSAGSAGDESLLAGHNRTGLRSRWDDVQAGFVDDPRGCVHQADELVSEVIHSVTTRLSQARSSLEEQWARGEQVSTEDLRLALKRYREFFDRLLAV